VPSTETARSGWPSWAARAVVSVAILTAAALFADIEALPRALATMPLQVLCLAFLLNLVGSILVPAAQTRIAAGATGIRLRTMELVSINLMVRFFMLVLPRPAAVGIRWLAYREGGAEDRGTQAAALMVYERVAQLAVISGALVFLLAADRGRLPAAADAVLLAGSGLFLLALGGLAAFWWPRVSVLPRWLVTRRWVPDAAARLATRLLNAVIAFPKLPTSRKAAVVILAMVSFVLSTASFWVLLLGLRVELGFGAVAWIRSLVFLFTLVPVTIAGIGVREAGFVALLGLYDVPEAESLAAAVAALGVQLAIGALGGAIALLRQWRGRSK
jgi:hypothetical protein